MRRVSFVAAALALLLVAAGHARQPAEGQARPAFRFERSVESAGAGPRRLEVDVSLLAGSRGDLRDLRLFGPGGTEIPYLLIQPVENTGMWTDASVLPIPTTPKTSGFEADLQEPAAVDALRVSGLPAPFLKRLALEGSGDRAHWTVLLPEATLFDLPNERLQQLELSFTPGDYRYVRVTWNDTNSGRVKLPGAVQVRRVSPFAPRRLPLTAALSVEGRRGEPGTSRYRLRLPAPDLPVSALALLVDNDRVMRQAIVTEPRLSGGEVMPVELGRATLKRVVRDEAAAEALRIPIAQPIGSQLDLSIDDGSNPPLRLTSVMAVVERQPDIYFEADGSPIVARYGNERLAAPRYDLAAARDTIRIQTVAAASWGEPRALTRENAVAPAPVSMSTGATIDLEGFGTVRRIPPGAAGLVALEIDAAALAHSTGPDRGFSDVRIIDAGGRQVPYLVERGVAPLVSDLRLSPRRSIALEAAGSVSQYEIALPYAQLPQARVALGTSARIFTRHVVVGREHAADRLHRDTWFEALVRADWSHEDSESAAPFLTMALRPVDSTRLLLRIEEGDNAPLPIASARLTLPGYRLRFYRSDSDALRLAYGRTDLASPRYDIRLLAGEVLGRPAADISAAAEPPQTGESRSPLVSPYLFWSVLGIAVVVLVGLAARLVSKGV